MTLGVCCGRLGFQHAERQRFGLTLDLACAYDDVMVVQVVQHEPFFCVQHLAPNPLEHCDCGVSLLAWDAHRSSVVDVQQVLRCNTWLRSSGGAASSQVSPVRAPQALSRSERRLDGSSGAGATPAKAGDVLAAITPRTWGCASC